MNTSLKLLPLMILALLNGALAAAEVPSFVATPISYNSVQKKWGIFLEAPAKHHFNLKAPMSAEITPRANGKTLKFEVGNPTEKNILFTLLDATIALSDEAKVIAYLCDDAKTFCVKQQLKVMMGVNVRTDAPPMVRSKLERYAKEADARTKVSESKTGDSKAALGKKPGKAKKDVHGFWDNDPAAAIAESVKSDKPLMIDFYGIWCPPCNMLNDLVFPKKQFKAIASKFVLLKMDADLESSWELKSKFKIGGYPTLLMAQSDLQEIDRVVGYLDLNDLVKRMTEAHQFRTQTLAERVEQLKGKPEYLSAAKRLIYSYFEKNEYSSGDSLATEILKTFPGDLELRVLAAEATYNVKGETVKKDKKQLIAFLEKGMFPQLLKDVQENKQALSSNALIHMNWLTVSALDALSGDKLDSRLAFKSQLLHLLQELYSRVNPKTLFIEQLETSVADIDAMKMDLAEAVQDDVLLKEAREGGVSSYRKLIELYKNRDSRGFNLELAYFLRKTGRTQEAKEIYDRFIKKYPKEFTFYYAASKFYFETKDYVTARSTAEKAVEFAYGDNKIRCVEQLAKVMNEQGETDHAVKLIEDFIAGFKVPSEDLKIRTRKQLDSLSAYKEKLKAEKKK